MKELVDQGFTKFRKIVFPTIVVAFVLYVEYRHFARGTAHGSFLGPLALGGFFLWVSWNCEGQWADSVVDAGESLDIRRGSVSQRVSLSQIEIGRDRVVFTRGGAADLVTLRFLDGGAFGDSISFIPKDAVVAVVAHLGDRKRQMQRREAR